MEKRNFRIYCVTNYCEFELRFDYDGVTLARKVKYSFEEILEASSSFLKENCKLYGVDLSCDTLVVELNYKF